jgi:hypothetical protein
VALLEDGNTCCICDERKVHRCIGSVPAYYCAHCFEIHKSDILGRAPWVKMLLNGERQRRKRRNRLLTAGYVLAAVYSENAGVAPRTRTHQQVQYVS